MGNSSQQLSQYICIDNDNKDKCTNMAMYLITVIHMKKFVEVCLYNQCTIFIAAAINHANTNVLMMWQKTQTFTLKSVLLSL